MYSRIHFPKYAYEALKNWKEETREHLCYALMAYLFDETEPDLSGWDACVFALLAADLEERERMIAAGGPAVLEVLDPATGKDGEPG